MPDFTFDLSDGTNWIQRYQHLHVVTPVPGDPRAYNPIEPFTIPHSFSSPILAATAESQHARSWWWLGARVRQLLDVSDGPIQVGGQSIAISLNRAPNLLVLHDFGVPYTLLVDVPYWHQEMMITVWEYVVS